MKILVLDVYPRKGYRVTKDTNGGYGTSNDYGRGLIPYLLTRLVAKGVDWPPMFSAYAAGALRHAGHEVRYSRDVADAAGADLCVLPSSIVAHETEVEAVRTVTAQGIPAMVIGPFAGSVPEPYIAAGGKVLGGEPEMYLRASLPPTVEGVKALPDMIPAAAAAEVDALGFYPAWDLMTGSAPRMRFIGKGMTVPILATRGCPYSCSYYCTYPLQQGRKVRARDPEHVVGEMAHWQDTLGVGSFIFRDPVFSIDRRHTLALCDAIERSGRKFAFGIETHLKNLDDELVARLKRAGLRMIYVGIESVTPEVIKDARRFSLAVDEQSARVRMVEAAGVKLKAMYIFGLPRDTVETCEAAIRYAVALNSTYAQFNIFTPYPGTPIFQTYRERIVSRHYEDFGQSMLVFRHDNLSPADARDLLSRAYSRYYGNPAWWLRHALQAFA